MKSFINSLTLAIMFVFICMTTNVFSEPAVYYDVSGTLHHATCTDWTQNGTNQDKMATALDFLAKEEPYKSKIRKEGYESCYGDARALVGKITSSCWSNYQNSRVVLVKVAAEEAFSELKSAREYKQKHGMGLSPVPPPGQGF